MTAPASDGATPHAAPDATALTVRELEVYYGASHVLRGMSLDAPSGRITAVLGRNGMGKTTLMHAIAGMVPARHGDITLFGQSLAGLRSWRRARLGLALVPQGRRIFSSLTVRENLDVIARGDGPYDLDRVAELFPNLAERINQRAGSLSGGEQQMLAIARALLTSPRLLLMDEPSEGLAPIVVRRLATLIRRLGEEGMTVLLVEQNLRLALEVADHVSVMGRGTVVFSGTPDEVRDAKAIMDQHLGV